MARVANQAAIDRIKAARSKSLQLMQMDASGALDKIAEGRRGDVNDSLIDGGATINEMMGSTKNAAKKMAPNVNRGVPPSSSNVPKAILESFTKNPIDESVLYGALGSDGNDISFLTEDVAPKRQQVATQPIQQRIVETVQASSQIDYPMIRNIVEETVRKYAQSLNKRIINESKGNSQVNEISTIALGDTFKFLAKDGTLYECTMKKIGNISNKKKSTN